MLSFHDAAAIAAAPTTMSNDVVLQTLLADHIHDWTATDLLELTHLLIVQAGDTEEAIQDQISFSPFDNKFDGLRFGDAGFEPAWDWLERHSGWFEMIATVGNDGFAFVLFIEDSDGTDPQLRRLCQTYAPEARN